MAEEATGGAGGNLLKEFQGAKPPEKAIIVLGILAVLGVAFYLYKKGMGGQNASSPVSTASGQTAGYPTVGAGNTPVLPNGVNPLYDPNGNLIAFQNPATGGAGGSGNPPPTPDTTHPANWFTNFAGKLGYSAVIRPGGFDTNGQRFWIGKTGNSNLFYAPIGSTIQYGGQGRVWLSPGGDQSQHLLLTGPGQGK